MSVRVDVDDEPEARRGQRWLATALWLLLALLLALAFWLLLHACGLRMIQGTPLLHFCPASVAAPAVDPALAAEIARQRALEDQIQRLELALLRAPPCATSGPIPGDAWDRRDVGFLEGCWDLETEYRVRNVETDAVREAASWRVCFDAEGRGTQTFTFDDGIACVGPMLGSFEGAGRLQLSDVGDLRCEDDFYIHERQMTCERIDALHAQCETYQPETGTHGAGAVFRHRPEAGD